MSDIEEPDPDAEQGDPPYPDFENIDFSLIHTNLRSLVFADDVFLNMQAMNIAVIDKLITAKEYELLEELNEIERTPLDSMMLVSALSQMWIFALYEFLRTWGSRVANFQKQHANGQLASYIERTRALGDSFNTMARVLSRQASAVYEDPSLLEHFEKQQSALARVDELLDILRINLGKHEAPEKRNSISPSPGYGRINSFCGAVDFELLGPKLDSVVANRRDVAEELRNLQLPSRNEQPGGS